MASRTIHLVERVPKCVRLTRADVAMLRDASPRRWDIEPLLIPSGYRLTALGLVGRLALASTQVVIRPKIRDCQLFHLLGQESPRWLATPTHWGDGVLEYFACRFVDALQERVRAGLHRTYVEQAGEGAYLQGRLDVAAQLRQSVMVPRFHTHVDTLTLDHPLHQLVKSAGVGLLDSVGLTAETRRRIEASLQPLAEVRLLEPTIDPDAMVLDRLTSAYAELLEWSRWVLTGIRQQQGRGFLLHLESIFERYLERELRVAWGDALRLQPDAVVDALDGQGEPLRFRPDLLLDRAGRSTIILDAKWKAFRGVPDADDVHQVLAYAQVFGVSDVRLIFPARRDRRTVYPLGNGVRLSVQQLRVTGTVEACRRGMKRLIDQLMQT